MRYLFSLIAIFALLALSNSFSIAAEDTKKENEKTAKSEAASNPPTSKPEVEVINLTVYPAPLPRPALKYRLLPTYLDMTPGNAATLYYRNFRGLDRYFDHKDGVSLSDINKSLDAPLNDLRKDKKMVEFLNAFSLKEMEYATRRTDCDWGIPIRESDDLFGISMPGIHDVLNYAKIIALKARLEIAEGNPAKAIECLRIGYAFSRHVARGPTVICVAAGNVIANSMGQQILEECQMKDSPNLYWALTDVPHPFIDSGDAFEYEFGGVFFLAFKELSEARTGSHSAEQWQEIWNRFVEKYNNLVSSSATNDNPAFIDAQKVLKEKYPVVCEQLKTRGWSEKDIESKAPSHLMLLYCAELCKEIQDEELKWTRVPYSQLPENFLDQEAKLFQHYSKIEIIPLSKQTGQRSIIVRFARTEQLFAVLRAVEALRLYASGHEGKLPSALEEIKEVPIPLDPWTNKAISYRLQGDIAVISVKYPHGFKRSTQELQFKWSTQEYQIRITK